MKARLSRAKSNIHGARIPLRVPRRAEMRERLETVLEAICGAYGEGWSDPARTDASVRNLVGEAIWLGQLVIEQLPDEPEALGLLALMLCSHARLAARRDAAGEFVRWPIEPSAESGRGSALPAPTSLG